MEPRCRWLEQDPSEPGIFGAMNEGFFQAAPFDWLLFWGSDDWAAGPDVFQLAITALESASPLPDLLVCQGRYAVASSGTLARRSMFRPAGVFTFDAYRRALLLGFTPPHQATMIGAGARRRLARYAPGFRLSADLDYFLQLSRFCDICVHSLDLELVHMADTGVSSQQTQRRLDEVRRAYRRRFGLFWWFPFLARYIHRLTSLLNLS